MSPTPPRNHLGINCALLHGVGESSPEWAVFSELAHLSFKVATAAEMEDAMDAAGFDQVSSVDRNAWYAPITIEEVKQLEGSLRHSIIEVSSEEIYNHWIKVRRALRDATNAGALRPTHLRGYRPAV